MNVPRLDVEVVGRRLRSLRDTLDELEALRGATAERLTARPLERAAAERLLQVAVDLAVDINAHIAVALLQRAPSTGRQSFEAAAAAGAIDAELADRLAPAAAAGTYSSTGTRTSAYPSSPKPSEKCSTGSRPT